MLAACAASALRANHVAVPCAVRHESSREGAPEPNDFYSQVHPTWTATHALRDRDFARAHEASRGWEVVIRALTREVGWVRALRTEMACCAVTNSTRYTHSARLMRPSAF